MLLDVGNDVVWQKVANRESTLHKQPNVGGTDVVVNQLFDDANVVAMLVENVILQQKRMRIRPGAFKDQTAIVAEDMVELKKNTSTPTRQTSFGSHSPAIWKDSIRSPPASSITLISRR